MHTSIKNTKFNKQNAKILGRVVLLLWYLPSNRPPPLIRTSADAMNYTPPTATATSY